MVNWKNKEKRRLYFRRRYCDMMEYARQFKKQCALCGYDKCVAALDFHHINKNKEFKITDVRTYSKIKLKIEIDKCIVLCSNCHREIHFKEYKDKQVLIQGITN
jgi:hypothetical protein